MFKQIILTLILAGCSLFAMAQHTVKGKVTDDTDKALSFTTVALLNPVDSTLMFFGVTNEDGLYKIKNVKPGNYLMQFSYVGMQTHYDEVSIPAASGDDFGTKKLSASLLEEVIVEAEYVPIKFKSDTVEFNANAFDTKPDAVVEDLLKKIPGVEVDKSGNVKAMGEDVTKVLVDGKEFFGKDTKVATKNLPADAIEKIQVFDKKSEEAEFTGIDDGVQDRTINLLLNKENKKGYFGDAEVGVGTDDRYNAKGNLFRFSSKLQSALLGMYNNINDFGYSGKGHGNWGQQIDGENTTLAGGLNLSYNAEGNNRYFLSYLASSNEKILEQQTATENFLNDESYEQYQNLDKVENGVPHKINFGVRHNFNKKHNFTLDGDVNLSTDAIEDQIFTNSLLNSNPVNNLVNLTNDNSSSVDASARAVYIAKLNGQNTQLKVNLNSAYTSGLSEIDWANTTTLYDPEMITVVDQYQDNNTEELNLTVNPTLIQRISPYWFVNLSAPVGLNNENLDRKQGAHREEATYEEEFSPNFSANETFVRPALSIQRNTKNSQISFTLGATVNQFDKILESTSLGKDNYTYFTPGFRYQNQYKKGRRIRVRYNTSVNMPSVNQLVPVVNNINPLSLYEGNIDLTPEYRHNMNVSWSIFDQFSFTSLFARLSGSYTKDKIGTSQSFNEDFIRVIKPVNVDYQYTASSMIYFSTPIRRLGMKVNVVSRENWSKGISFVNSEENILTSITHSLDLSLENRNTEFWFVKVGSGISLTDAQFSIAEKMNNVYFNTSYYADLRYTPNDHWSFETGADVANYNSESLEEVVSIPLLSASVSYFFGKGEKMSFTLKGKDLLNKNTSFQQINETNYLMQQTKNVLGRYVMLSFRMKLGKQMM